VCFFAVHYLPSVCLKPHKAILSPFAPMVNNQLSNQKISPYGFIKALLEGEMDNLNLPVLRRLLIITLRSAHKIP